MTYQHSGKQPRQFHPWLRGAHKGLAYQEGVDVGIAQLRYIGRRQYAAFGHDNPISRNAIFKCQRGIQRDLKSPQVAIIYADERCFEGQRPGQLLAVMYFDKYSET